MACVLLQAKGDALNPGVNLFIKGDLDGAITFFSKIAKRFPYDRRSKEILGNCWIIKGKDLLREGDYSGGRDALIKARKILPKRQDIKMLRLLAELEENVPFSTLAISTASLDISEERDTIFDCVFGIGKCSGMGSYIVHIVRKGETMSIIAIKYYNDSSLWEKIWEANPRIWNPHRLEKGTRLIIPILTE